MLKYHFNIIFSSTFRHVFQDMSCAQVSQSKVCANFTIQAPLVSSRIWIVWKYLVKTAVWIPRCAVCHFLCFRRRFSPQNTFLRRIKFRLFSIWETMSQNSIHNYIFFFAYYRRFSVLDSRWKNLVTADFSLFLISWWSTPRRRRRHQ